MQKTCRKLQWLHTLRNPLKKNDVKMKIYVIKCIPGD